MEQLLTLFFPAFISLKLFDHLHGGRLSAKDSIIYFGIFVVLIRYGTIIVMRYLFDIELHTFTVGYSVRYLTMAILMAMAIPFALSLLLKGLTVNFAIRQNKRTKR